MRAKYAFKMDLNEERTQGDSSVHRASLEKGVAMVVGEVDKWGIIGGHRMQGETTSDKICRQHSLPFINLMYLYVLM